MSLVRICKKSCEAREREEYSECNKKCGEEMKTSIHKYATPEEVAVVRYSKCQSECSAQNNKKIKQCKVDCDNRKHEIKQEHKDDDKQIDKPLKDWIGCVTQVKNKMVSGDELLFKKWLENAESECGPYDKGSNWIQCAVSGEENEKAFNDLVKQMNADCWDNNIRPTGLIKDLEITVKASKNLIPMEKLAKCATQGENKPLFNIWLKNAEKKQNCGSFEKFINDENSDWIKCAVTKNSALRNSFNKWFKEYTNKCEPSTTEFIKDIKNAVITEKNNVSDQNLSDTYHDIDLLFIN